MAQVATGWVFTKPNVTPILGLDSIDRIDQAADAVNFTLTPEEAKYLERCIPPNARRNHSGRRWRWGRRQRVSLAPKKKSNRGQRSIKILALHQDFQPSASVLVRTPHGISQEICHLTSQRYTCNEIS